MYRIAGGMSPYLPEMSIVIPVFNGTATLRACLEALQNAPGPTRELIVVDDGSKDGSAAIAESMGVRVVTHAQQRGCGQARNTGVKHTTAPILVFVDSDVVIDPNALERITSFMAKNSEYAAVFGSYDAEPGDPGFVSQYRNLLHRFIHQQGKREAETFWTGLGAVRRSAFQSVGGFRPDGPIIADVLLGLDLSDAGFRIRSDPDLLGKHLKPWPLWTMVQTDVFLRAVPWTEIILARGGFTNDLNTSAIYRVGVVSANVAVACLLMAAFVPAFLAVAVLAMLATLRRQRAGPQQFWRERGPLFTLGVVPLHIVHQLCSSVGFAIGLKRHYLSAVPSRLGRRHFDIGSQGSALDGLWRVLSPRRRSSPQPQRAPRCPPTLRASLRRDALPPRRPMRLLRRSRRGDDVGQGER